MPRPASIVTFERCYVGAWVVGIINLILGWNSRLAMADTPAAEGTFGHAGLATVIIGGVVLGAIITFILWYFVARRASVVAKWIVVVFFGFAILGFLSGLGRGTVSGGIAGIVTVVSIVLQAVAVWMLFRPDALAWFAGRRDGGGY